MVEEDIYCDDILTLPLYGFRGSGKPKLGKRDYFLNLLIKRPILFFKKLLLKKQPNAKPVMEKVKI